MRVRHPPVTLALILTLSLLAALALSVCGAPHDEPSPAWPTRSPGNPGNPCFQDPPGSPRPSIETAIVVSAGVMTVDEPLNIVGSGFLPGEPVTLALVIDNIVSYLVGGRTAEQPTANAVGAFTVSLDSIRGDGDRGSGVLERAPGIRTIRAYGEDGSLASFPVVIISANAPATSVLSSLTATAETRPNWHCNSLEVTVTVAGAGFMPNEAVTVTVINLPPGNPDETLVRGFATRYGAFVLDTTLRGVAPAEGADPEMPIEPGVYTILAEGDNGSEATGALVVEDR